MFLIDAGDIEDIHKYLMKKNILLKFIKQTSNALSSFSGSLAHTVKISDHTKCISLSKELCLARPTLIDLNSNEFHYHPFMVSLDR